MISLWIALVAYAVLAWKNRRAAFLLFLAFLPAYLIRLRISGVPTTALELMFAILFFTWMLRREKRLIDIRGWGCFLLAWLAVATVSLFVSPDFRAAAGIWKAYFVEPILFFILANDLLRTQRDRDDALWALAGAATLVGLPAILQHWTHWMVPPPFNGMPIPPATQAEFRSTSFYGFPNAIGLFLAPLALLFTAQAFRRLPLKRYPCEHWLWVTAAWICIGAAAFAQSEGAMIGMAAGIGFMALMHKKTRLPAIVAGAIIAAALLIIPATRTIAIEKLTLNDWSGRVRKEMWAETWSMLKDRPALGAGLAGYPIVFDRYHKARHIEIFQYPHDILLNFWVETGIAGVLVFLLLLWRFFSSLRGTCFEDPNKHLWTVGLASAMVTLLVHGLVDVPYFKNDLAMLFWLLCALASSTMAEARSKKLDETLKKA